MYQTQFCLKCHNDVESDEHLTSCVLQVDDIDEEIPSEWESTPTLAEFRKMRAESTDPNFLWEIDPGHLINLLEDALDQIEELEMQAITPEEQVKVITGFSVVVGHSGRAAVLGGVPSFVAIERGPDARDIQSACREISDDLLAHRTAEYGDVEGPLTAISDILGELATRVPAPEVPLGARVRAKLEERRAEQ